MTLFCLSCKAKIGLQQKRKTLAKQIKNVPLSFTKKLQNYMEKKFFVKSQLTTNFPLMDVATTNKKIRLSRCEIFLTFRKQR